MSNNFIHNISKYGPLMLLLNFLNLLAPKGIKLIKNVKLGKNINFTFELKDLIFILSLILLIVVLLEGLIG